MFRIIRLQAVLLFVTLIVLIPAVFAQNATPPLGHLVVVALENQSYADVVGSPYMPYLNSLIAKGGLATNYFADEPGSIPDYFMLTAGEQVTHDASFGCQVSVDNLVRRLNSAGKTWKSYAEDLPSQGYLGSTSGEYVKWHNPFAYFSDVANDSGQRARLLPFSQFTSDIASGALPNFSFVVPNQTHNAHDCPDGTQNCSNSTKLSAADQWLQSNIAPVLSSSQFQQDGLLVLWFDESNGDTSNGGGKVAVVLVGPTVKQGYQSATFYRHENLLRTIAEALQIGFPGAALYVNSMSDFFGATSTGGGGTTGTGTVSGRVVDITTGAGISGASVSYSGGSTTCNSSGYFTFNNVAAGSYTITASASGYFTESTSTSVTAGATATPTVKLPTGGKVEGKITNSAGAAMAGVPVKISGGSVATSKTVTTDSTGYYRSGWVPVGGYTVTASPSGYTAQSASATVKTGLVTSLNFTMH